MGRRHPHLLRVLALIAALGLIHGCREREQLEKEAPVLARADFRIDRIAVVGVVSDVVNLEDSPATREGWSSQIGGHLGRERFGHLPIVTCGEVRALIGAAEHDAILDRFKDDGGCDSVDLVDLATALEGQARFVVFGTIQDDQITRSDSEVETEDKDSETTTRTRTMTTSRTASVRLRFYDLSDQRLVWDHTTAGLASVSKSHDMSDFIEHSPKEGFFGGLITSMVNSAIKPDPGYPKPPAFEKCLGLAYDNVGLYLKPGRKK